MNQFTHRFSVAKRLILLALLLSGTGLFAQVTTSTISGVVTDKNGEALIGATVVATHPPTPVTVQLPMLPDALPSLLCG
jgi:hypothetical protein